MAIDAPTMESTEDSISRALAVKSPQYLQLTNEEGTRSEYIRDGWSWGGFSFGVFWLMRHRVWRSILLSLVALIVGGIAMLGAVRYLGNTDIAKTIAGLTLATLALLHLFLGTRGNLWRQSSLVERGWIPVRKIFAKNVDEAMEVGESGLSDLSVHRVAAATQDNAPAQKDLPELRPLLKTGEPEIRTVRRPEAIDDEPGSSEELGSVNELLNQGDKSSNTAETATLKAPADADTDIAGSQAASTATPGDQPTADELVSDTSSFEAPAPLRESPLQNDSTTRQPEQNEPSERNIRASQEPDVDQAAESKPTTSSMAASMAASARNTFKKTTTTTADDRIDVSTDAVDKAASDSLANSVRADRDTDAGDAGKRLELGSSAEDLFEKTLGAPRRRPAFNTKTGDANKSSSANTAEDAATHTDAGGSEPDDAKTTAAPAASRPPSTLRRTVDADSQTDKIQPQREQRNDRLRVEPTLRPRDTENTAPETADTSTGIGDADSRRRIENENNELFEVAWNEIEKGKMVAALEARALSQHPDNPDQRKALYIRMRVAQLKEEKLLAREEIASQRRRRAQRVAELEREEVYRDFVQIIQPDYAALRVAKPTLASFARSSDSDTNLSLKTLNDSVDRIGMTVVFAPMAGYVAEASDGRMLELGNREQLNEFLLVLMNSDRTIGEHGSVTAPGRDVPPQSPTRSA